MPAYPGDRSAEITATLRALPSGSPVSEVAQRLMDLFTSGSIAPGMLVDLLHVVRSLLQVYADRAVHDDEQARIAIDEHDAVLRAVTAEDADAAASAMAVHMATATARLRTEAAAG